MECADFASLLQDLLHCIPISYMSFVCFLFAPVNTEFDFYNTKGKEHGICPFRTQKIYGFYCRLLLFYALI